MTEKENTKKQFGDFEIIRELGRGGVGIVYEARQVSLNRKVALKAISGSLGLSSKAVLRFQREAEAAGKLHHTNIVPIYSTGNDDGAHYYVMELIDGPSLHQVILSLRRGEENHPKVRDPDATVAVAAVPAVPRGDPVLESSDAVETPAWVSEILGSPPLSGESTPAPESNAAAGSTSRPSSGSHLSSGYFDSVATMVAGVADGLDYAHENGVIHRDIKPANLLLSRDGRVSINDFGLARMLEQPGMTLSGEFVGSPLYMSPEQITAGRAPLDHRTDIYSLGATLYELLTLRPVFPGRSRDEVIAQILHKEPERPRRHNPKIPVDLETICLKAMEKDPDRRYQTAGQLAEDLRRFVNRHAISARRIGPVERSIRWARKNKALTAMACLTLVVILGAALYVYVLDREHRRGEAIDKALLAAMSGRSAEAIVEIEKAGALGAKTSWVNMLLGRVALFEGKPKEARARLEEAISEDPKGVMVLSTLAECYLEEGRFYDYMQVIDLLDELPAEKPEELLFKARAIRLWTPEQALQWIAEAIQRGGAPNLARLSRAEVETSLAVERGELDHVLEALDELRVLSRDLGDNPALSDARLQALLTAYHLYECQGASEHAEQYLQEAEADVRYLEGFPGYYSGNRSRLAYYDRKSDLEAMKRVIEGAAESGGSGRLVLWLSPAFFAAGPKRAQEALDELNRLLSDDHVVLVTRGILLTETLSGRQDAEAICDTLIERSPVDLGLLGRGTWDVTLQYFLGRDTQSIQKYARKRAANLADSKYSSMAELDLRYLSGEISAEEFVRRVGDSALRRAIAYLSIGMRQLAGGSRQAAKKSFKRSADSALFWTPSLWSRAFLARMEKDDTWPDWLPATPIGSEAK